MIAALFVVTGGVYFIPGIDPWDEDRDARSYSGPHPVIAHPPCERWGRYWFGGPSVRVRKIKGDDGGCFNSAMRSVEKWGGIIEHPEASHAWAAFGLTKPPKSGGWVRTRGGWTCCVEQGHYGHRARKATWLYLVLPSGLTPPELKWGSSGQRSRLDQGFHSREERAAAKRSGTYRPVECLSKLERVATPIEFRDLLINLVRPCIDRNSSLSTTRPLIPMGPPRSFGKRISA